MQLGNGIIQCDQCGYIQRRRPSSEKPARCNNCHTIKVHDEEAREKLREQNLAKLLINTSEGYQSLIEEADRRIRKLEAKEQSYEDEEEILAMREELLYIKKLFEKGKERVEQFLKWEPEIRGLEKELSEIEPGDLEGEKLKKYENAKSKLEKIKSRILPRRGGE